MLPVTQNGVINVMTLFPADSAAEAKYCEPPDTFPIYTVGVPEELIVNDVMRALVGMITCDPPI